MSARTEGSRRGEPRNRGFPQSEDGLPVKKHLGSNSAVGLDYCRSGRLARGWVCPVIALWEKTAKPPDEGRNGILYSNPDDASLWVPKRYRIGYTLNFGNPGSSVLGLILVLILAPVLRSATLVRHLPS